MSQDLCQLINAFENLSTEEKKQALNNEIKTTINALRDYQKFYNLPIKEQDKALLSNDDLSLDQLLVDYYKSIHIINDCILSIIDNNIN